MGTVPFTKRFSQEVCMRRFQSIEQEQETSIMKRLPISVFLAACSNELTQSPLGQRQDSDVPDYLVVITD